MSPTIRRRNEQRTREILDGADDEGAGVAAGAAAECGRAAHESHEREIAVHLDELRAAGRVACVAGCSACCRLEVAATFPEMARLAQFVDATFEPMARAALVGRLEAQAAVPGGGRTLPRPPCVLLVDDRCSAYEARPLACRGWTSADAAPCFVALEMPEAPPSIPVNGHVRRAAIESARGIGDGVRERGLDDDPLGLAPALLALLTDGAALSASWLGGAMLPPSLKLPAAQLPHLDADGRWRIREDLAKGGNERREDRSAG